MSQNRLPPLNLNSARSDVSNEGSNQSSNTSARQRRRLRLQNQSSNNSNRSRNNSSNNLREENIKTKSQTNQGFESDEEAVNEKPKKTSDEHNPVKDIQKSRRVRRNQSNKEVGDQSFDSASRPPQARKKTRKNRTLNFVSNPDILEGLEDDIIEMEEEKKEVSDKDQFASDLSQRELINENQQTITKSVPTDKFYLELEKKFTIQKKEAYQKRENERLAQLFESQLKQKQKEDQKYQLSTSRTALYTHKFLRLIFLFVHGLNVGFQIWQTIVIYFINYNDFKLDLGSNSTLTSTPVNLSLMVLFENLTMPIHCLSYFFLTICIVDSMDRVDFTRMSGSFLIKCLSFQNQFWSIVFYMIAILVSLSIIFIDESVYISSYLDTTNFYNRTTNYFLDSVETNGLAWKSVSIVKSAFSLLAWLLFSVFVQSDNTYESLKNRDFTILDDIVPSTSNENDKKQSKA